MKLSFAPIVRLMLALPRWLAVTCITGVSIALSIVLTLGIMLRMDSSFDDIVIALSIALIVPSLVATPVGIVLLGLMHELEAARHRAQELACTDLLTGVLNRRRFIELAEGELERARSQKAHCAIVILDIDYFKDVNDRHGHHAGDQVLKTVARACIVSLREQDHFARWGGEEFVACLPGVDLAGARTLAERLRVAVRDAGAHHGGTLLKVTVSIGVSSREQALHAFDELMAHADRAMYQAKVGGRDAVVCALAQGRQDAQHQLPDTSCAV